VDKLDDVWTSRDYPMLLELARRFENGTRYEMSPQLAKDLDQPQDEVIRSLTALRRRGLINTKELTSAGPVAVTDINGAAYLITGLHPDGDDALSGLISALRQAADESGDEDERGRLRKAADALAGVGRDLGVGLMTAVISRYATGG
jgi:hypothetical protein